MGIVRKFMMLALTSLWWAPCAPIAAAQQPAAASPPAGSSAQEVLAHASEHGQYTFLLFYRRDDAATEAMARALHDGLKNADKPATAARVSLASSVDQPLVRQFGMARAPMPMIVAVAPNGAITGVFPQKFAAKQVNGAFVSPGMMHSMKAMQEKKLVFVCIQSTPPAPTPTVFDEFAADPLYKDRMAVVSVAASDPAEKLFMDQLEIVPAKHTSLTMAVLAPPAVLVGKFAATATKETISDAIVEAGKCCDDPNCKHRKTARSDGKATR